MFVAHSMRRWLEEAIWPARMKVTVELHISPPAWAGTMTAAAEPSIGANIGELLHKQFILRLGDGRVGPILVQGRAGDQWLVEGRGPLEGEPDAGS